MANFTGHRHGNKNKHNESSSRFLMLQLLVTFLEDKTVEHKTTYAIVFRYISRMLWEQQILWWLRTKKRKHKRGTVTRKQSKVQNWHRGTSKCVWSLPRTVKVTKQ